MTTQPKFRVQLDHDELRALWLSPMTTADIANHFMCTMPVIRDRAKWLDLPRRINKGGWAPAVPVNKISIDHDAFMTLWDAGLTCEMIGAQLGCSKKTITRHAQEFGLAKRPRQFVRVAPKQPKPREPWHKPTPHIAAVRMPADPIRDRSDYGDLMAAIQRAKTRPGPVVSMGMIATRFRLPVAVVHGLAGI